MSRTATALLLALEGAEDPREDDAELFASLVRLGPRHTRSYIEHL